MVSAAKVTKVTWTKGQGGSRLFLGGKAVLGEGCRASRDSSRDACFLHEKRTATIAAALLHLHPKLTSAGHDPDLCRDRGLCRGPSAPGGGPCRPGGDYCLHSAFWRKFCCGRQRRGHLRNDRWARSADCRGSAGHCGSGLHSAVSIPNIPAGAHG